jgi:hypothetical protein
VSLDRWQMAHERPGGEQLMSGSQPRLCTPVDICWNFIERLQLPATFRHARHGFPIARLDPQVASYEADPA